jgi:DNA-binding NarL/FixJ family response regulator
VVASKLSELRITTGIMPLLARLIGFVLATIIRHRLRESGARNVPLGPRAATRSNPAGLTRRELQVLELLFEGLSNAELSKQLHLSTRTVEHHISSIMSKLNVRTRLAAARAAKRLGLTPDLVRRNGAPT